MSKTDIQVVILNDSKSVKCEASCGVNWSSPETIALARQRIKDRFGGRVKLEYIDLSKTDRYAPGIKQKIKTDALPMLLIDAETRISGQFDIRMLVDAIEAEIELRQ